MKHNTHYNKLLIFYVFCGKRVPTFKGTKIKIQFCKAPMHTELLPPLLS